MLATQVACRIVLLGTILYLHCWTALTIKSDQANALYCSLTVVVWDKETLVHIKNPCENVL